MSDQRDSFPAFTLPNQEGPSPEWFRDLEDGVFMSRFGQAGDDNQCDILRACMKGIAANVSQMSKEVELIAEGVENYGPFCEPMSAKWCNHWASVIESQLNTIKSVMSCLIASERMIGSQSAHDQASRLVRDKLPPLPE